MMKILHIIPSLLKGGAERLTIDICHELKRRGIEIAIATLHPGNEFEVESKDLNCIVLNDRVKLSVWNKNRYETHGLLSFCKEFQPTVIHSHLFEADIFAKATLIRGVKYFTHCHDNMSQLAKPNWANLFTKKGIADWYEREWIIKRYRMSHNQFIAISQNTSDYFHQVLPNDLHKNIHLLLNAIDVNKFGAGFRTAPKSNLQLINCGSFVPKKNQHFLLDCMTILVKRHPGIHLTLLGDGPLLPSFKNRMLELKLENHITCMGKVNDPERYYEKADIYVHSATYEPFGLVLLEAMAAGLPVVALDGLGNRDLVTNGLNGFILNEADPIAFTERIESLAANPTDYVRISEAARNFSLNFDIKNYVDKLILLYQGE